MNQDPTKQNAPDGDETDKEDGDSDWGSDFSGEDEDEQPPKRESNDKDKSYVPQTGASE